MKKRILPLIFIFPAFLAALLVYDRAFDTYDDGVASTGAMLILHGKVPYRDFWAVYAPGTNYVNAFLMKISGESLLAIRMILPLLVAIQAAFLYGILKRIVPKTWPIVAVGAAFTAFVPLGIFFTNPLTYWFTFAIASIYFLVLWMYEPKPRWEYACGLCLGASTLFRQDGGVYLALAVFPLIILAGPKIKAGRVMPLLRLYGSFTLVVGGAVAWFAYHGALGALWDQTIRFAVMVFPKSRKIAYPVPWLVPIHVARFATPLPIEFIHRLFTFYLLPFSLAVLGMMSFARLWRTNLDRRQMALCAVTFAALVLFAMVRVRPVCIRILFSVSLGLVAFAGYAFDGNKLVRRFSLALLVISLVAYLPTGAFTVRTQRTVFSEVITSKGGTYTFEGYGAIVSLVSQYIKERTTPDEKILAGAPLIYFTADREPITPYFEPHPLLVDRTDIQKETIKAMERDRVRFFVRSPMVHDSYFNIEPQNEPKILIDYINRNFKRTLDLCLLQVYERK